MARSTSRWRSFPSHHPSETKIQNQIILPIKNINFKLVIVSSLFCTPYAILKSCNLEKTKALMKFIWIFLKVSHEFKTQHTVCCMHKTQSQSGMEMCSVCYCPWHAHPRNSQEMSIWQKTRLWRWLLIHDDGSNILQNFKQAHKKIKKSKGVIDRLRLGQDSIKSIGTRF